MLRGRALVLRLMRPEDVGGYVFMRNKVEGRSKESFCIESPTEAMRSHFATSSLGQEEGLLAIDVGARRHVGVAHFFLANPAVSNMELEVQFYRDEDDTIAHRQEALRLLARYLFDNRPYARLQLLLPPADDTGKIAAKAAGFVQEGLLRQIVFVHGGWRDLELWSVLREELCDA